MPRRSEKTEATSGTARVVIATTRVVRDSSRHRPEGDPSLQFLRRLFEPLLTGAFETIVAPVRFDVCGGVAQDGGQLSRRERRERRDISRRNPRRELRVKRSNILSAEERIRCRGNRLVGPRLDRRKDVGVSPARRQRFGAEVEEVEQIPRAIRLTAV